MWAAGRGGGSGFRGGERRLPNGGGVVYRAGVMKPATLWICVLLVFSLAAAPLAAAKAAASGFAPAKEKPTLGVELAKTLSQITGVAISPMLGVSAIGAYKWFEAGTPEQQAALPWYAQPMYWLTGLIIVGAVALKDCAGATLPPGWKKPLDVAETLEHKISGLVAAGAFIPFTLESLTNLIGNGGGQTELLGSTGLARIHLGAINFAPVLNVLLAPLAIALFFIVWLTSNAINVLILLSPWGKVDAALKSMRMSVLGLVVVTPHINPWLGILCSVLVIILSYFLAGWSFRLSTYGWLFCWDFFTLRRTRFTPAPKENWVFAGKDIPNAPLRSYGRIARGEDGKLRFRFRPWLVFAEKQTELPDVPLAVGRGAVYPTVVGTFGDKEKAVLLMSPRYKGHEAELARACGIDALTDVGLRRAWGAIKELFGFENQRRVPVT